MLTQLNPILLFVLLLVSACSVKRPEATTSFSYNTPESVQKLPAELYEISGITALDSIHLACVQDEHGIVFQYSIGAERVSEQTRFYADGDFEGIAKVDNDLYVLRSDGVLFKIANFINGNRLATDSIVTNIPISNNEGLCFDAQSRRLLIASKGRVKGNKDLKDKRFVFAYHVDQQKMLDTPILTLDLKEVAAVMQEKGIELESTEKKNGKVHFHALKLMPSGIAISPDGLYYFMLSAVDRLLLKLNRQGKVVDVIALDENLYAKPEGLIFLPNGKLVISNEGHGGEPNLIVVGLVD